MNNTKTIWIVVGLIIIGGFAWTWHSKNTSQVSGDTIKIGGAFALTGDVAVYGEADRDGAQLAVDEINSKGGVNGKKLELLSEDTRSTSKDTVSAFLKLKNIDKVKYFIVSFLDSYPGAESLLGPNDLLISPDAGVEAMNGKVMHPNVFGTFYRTQPKTELIIKNMVDSGKKKLYMIVGDDAYYNSVVDYTKKAAEKYGLQIVGIDRLSHGSDIKSVLPKVTAGKADALFFGIVDEEVYVGFLKRKDDFLKNISIYTDENALGHLGSDYIRYMEGLYFYTNTSPAKKFIDAYKLKYNTEPGITASVSYDTVYIMAKEMENNPSDISAYMRSHSFDTVSYGTVTFDDIGGIQTDTKYFTIKQIKSGVPVDVLNN